MIYMSSKYDAFMHIGPSGLERNDEWLRERMGSEAFLNQLTADSQSGDAAAQFTFGVLLDGAHQYEQALSLYAQAAHAGYAPAMHYLAECLFAGDGIAKNETTAKEWMVAAFENGDSSAAYWLGTHYDEDSGPGRVFSETSFGYSSYWYAIGALAGNPMCQNNHAWCIGAYATSADDLQLQLYWYSLALQNGAPIASNFFRNNPGLTKLSPREITAFRQRRWPNRIMEFGSFLDRKKCRKPLKWIVVEETSDEMTLLSLYPVANPFGLFYSQENHNWEDSPAREYLNSVFLNNSFTQKEIQRMEYIDTSVESSPIYAEEDCKEDDDFYGEEDLVVVPSVYDLAEWDLKDEMKCFENPDTAVIKNTDGSTSPVLWALRTHGEPGTEHVFSSDLDLKISEDGYTCCYVGLEGKINYHGLSGLLGLRAMIKIRK